MKKHGLLKNLGIILLLVVIVSFILNGRTGEKDYVGLGDIAFNGLKSVYYFFYIALFIFAVGGFYGILGKTPSYKRLLDNIVKKIKPLGKKIIFIIIAMFAVIAAFTGITLPLIIFVPFVASIVLLLGYDKLVALTTTIGSIMVGYIGGVYVTFVNPSNYITSTFEKFVGMKEQFANTFPKLLLLLGGIALIIFFVNKHITNVENKKVKYELNDNSDLLINEVKGNYKEIKVWPLTLIMSLLFVVLVLGMFPWESLFGITFFKDFHTVIMSLTTGGLIVRLLTLISFFGLITLVRYIISLIKNKKFELKYTYPIMISVVALLVLEILNAAKKWNYYDLSFIKKVPAFFTGTIIVRLLTAIVIFGLVTLARYIIVLIKKKDSNRLTKLIKKDNYLLKPILSILIVAGILLVFEILNVTKIWNIYDLSFINNIAKCLGGTEFLNFSVTTSLISSDLLAFGAWTTMGDSMVYMVISFILIVFMIATAITYKVSFNDFIEGLTEGMKKVLPIVALTMIAYTILVCSYTNGFFEGIITSYGKFNYGISSMLTMLGCILNIDTYYIVAGVFTPTINLITDESVYPSVAILLQGINGVFNIVGPTSILAIFGLTYFDVPYTTWIKYIWRFILCLLILIALVALLVTLL